jgi:hypothetical protein
MAAIVQDIQTIRSLRKDCREIKLSPSILSAITTIHTCIKSGTDLNGWKKVDWRGGGGRPDQRQGGNSGGGAGGGYNRGGDGARGGRGEVNSFFNGARQSQDGHYAFGGRPRTGFSGRTANEAPQSIPLTSGNSPVAVPPQSSSAPQAAASASVSADGFRSPPLKYVSKFKKSSDNVEDTILNTILLGKLNKFSEQNYHEIKEFITHIIDNGQTDMIKCFMKLVFEKAASEEMFCPLYAKLLSELSAQYPVLLTEMANLYSVYMAIFEEVETNAENYNEVCKRNVEKKYRRGYSQFLAELIKHDVIDTEVFIKTINKIITQVENNLTKKESSKIIEEYADCLNKIMRAIQEDTDDDNMSDDSSESAKEKVEAIRTLLKGEMSSRIQPLSARLPENVGLSNKARFTFLDIYEGIQKF